jgi:cellulose synthase/poly-beta-1,6-N-acetylglucosamine synthase-like glycosyltransferase
VDQVIEEFKQQHFNIEVQRRANRKGFKAGALQAALENTEEKYIAIFDADFIPSEDFLLQTIPYFSEKENLGIVQSRWTHLNQDFSLLTQAIAHAIDVHFLVDQSGRFAGGFFQNFNGSGGVLRKEAVIEAGGWKADTLAEDLDLSYRMQMLGYRILYLRDLRCPGEIPPTVPSFKQQQGRWACGSLRNARLILPNLLKDRKYGFSKRFQAFIHLTGYLIHPLMVLSFLLSCFAVLLGVNYANTNTFPISTLFSGSNALVTSKETMVILIQNLIWVLLTPFIIVCTFGPWVSLISTLRFQNQAINKNFGSIVILILLGFGISLSNSREAVKGMFTNHPLEFTRTPKYADLHLKQEWRSKNYQVPFDPIWIAEFVFAILGFWSIGRAIQQQDYAVLVILILFTISYSFVFIFSILQSRNIKA